MVENRVYDKIIDEKIIDNDTFTFMRKKMGKPMTRLRNIKLYQE